MAVLASDLVTRALKALQVLGATEVPSTADMADGLTALNAMIDSWTNENLACFEVREQSAPLVIGQAAYTIGTGGNFNMDRPLKIEDAYIQDTNLDNFYLSIYERDKWNTIGMRAVTSNIPLVLFYDPQYPLGIINLFPIPTLAYTLFFDSYLPLTTFANQSTALATPQGYERAYVFNLAVEIGSQFGFAIPAPVAAIASESKGTIKRKNIREVIANYDPSIVTRAKATYNIYRDVT